MKEKILNVLGWLIAVLLFGAFMFAGITKIIPIEIDGEIMRDVHDQNFISWELPYWLMFFVGGLEVLGAIGVLIKGLRAYAGIGITALMICAMGVHFTNLEPEMIVPNIVLGSLAAVLTYIRRFELFYFMRSPKDDLDHQ